MHLTKEDKVALFSKSSLQNKGTDTGSAESQVTLFTERINHLTAHLQANKKDFSTRMGLLKLVGKRRRLLDHLYKTDIERYRALIAKLEIRK
jgi:small subunit ribosomal protein S15